MTAGLLAAALAAAAPAAAADARLRLTPVARELAQPVGLEAAPGEPGRLYVIEQAGRIRVLKDGKLLEKPFLDIAARVGSRRSEQGLLGLAFDPGSPRRFFLDYTDRKGNTVVSEWRASSADEADAGSERVVLRQRQPFANHNGGQVAFGPDGMLFIALGDGGAAADPHDNAQSLRTWLGKLLRIDVATAPYRVPPDNPFAKRPATPIAPASAGTAGLRPARPATPIAPASAGTAGLRPARADAKGEVWAWGLRNPWRFSFDGTRLVIADVGQDKWEEVDVEDLAEGGGKNYGWSRFEGLEPFKAGAPIEHRAPVFVYGHEAGDCSITGGFVYRGKRLPGLRGRYVFGDYCTGRLWALDLDTRPARTEELGPLIQDMPKVMISSFGRDLEGELYVVDHAGGAIYRLE